MIRFTMFSSSMETVLLGLLHARNILTGGRGSSLMDSMLPGNYGRAARIIHDGKSSNRTGSNGMNKGGWWS